MKVQNFHSRLQGPKWSGSCLSPGIISILFFICCIWLYCSSYHSTNMPAYFSRALHLFCLEFSSLRSSHSSLLSIQVSTQMSPPSQGQLLSSIPLHILHSTNQYLKSLFLCLLSLSSPNVSSFKVETLILLTSTKGTQLTMVWHNFSTFQYFKSHIHSVETVLWIWIFSQVSIMQHDTPLRCWAAVETHNSQSATWPQQR